MIAGWDEYHLINNELSRLVVDLPRSELGEVIGYVLSSPGKRVRPLILIFSSQAFRGEAARAMNAALAVELVHAASLVHDDILDCGIERRGAPSTLEMYGAEAALLAGDYLISRSIDLISSYRPQVIAAFARACMHMSEGEMMDLSSSGSPEEYYRCIAKKTASLFAASAKIGGLIASAPEEDVACLEGYGLHLGLAYQVLDDLEEYLGVNQGKRATKAKVVLPRIFGDLYSPEMACEICIKAIQDHSSAAKRALQSSSGDEAIKAQLEKIVDQMTLRGLDECRSQRNLC
jgi:octaprenyl-diphosphate synthase